MKPTLKHLHLLAQILGRHIKTAAQKEAINARITALTLFVIKNN